MMPRTPTTHGLLLVLMTVTISFLAGCRAMTVNRRAVGVSGAHDMIVIPEAAGDVIDSSAAADPEPPVYLSRRYWGDEMSSCIEIYCLRHLGDGHYLNCLQNYCPDAVVRVHSKRQMSDDPAPAAILLSSTQLASTSALDGANEDDDGHLVSVACSPTRRLHCIGGALCYVTTAPSKKPKISMSASRCAATECGGAPAFRQCVQVTCC